jgi:hypothetical protein
MSDGQREIYHSENGDKWLLCRGADHRVYIEHKANLSSGGKVTPIESGPFLGPEDPGQSIKLCFG